MVRRRIFAWAFVLPLVTAISLGCSGGGPDPGPTAPDELAVEALPEDLASRFSSDLDNLDVLDSDLAEMFPTPDPSATPLPLSLPADVMEHCPFNIDPPERPSGLIAGHSRSASGFVQTGSFDFGSANLVVWVFETKEAAHAELDRSVAEVESGEAPLLLPDECVDAYERYLSEEASEDVLIVQRERDPGFSIPGVRVWQVKNTRTDSASVESTVTTVAIFEYDYVVGRYSALESNEVAIDHEALIRAFVDRVVEAQSGG